MKGNHPPLLNNKARSLRKLANLETKLQHKNMRKGYAELIEQQKATRIVEGTNDTSREESSTFRINPLSMKGPKY